MVSSVKHRNSQKRIYGDGYLYFITANTQQKYPFFREPILCDLWIEELRLCQTLKQFELYAFCLLPDHFHLLVQPSSRANISQIMHCLKRNVSISANKILGYTTFHPACSEGAERLPHRKQTESLSQPSVALGDKAFCRLQRMRFETNILLPLKNQWEQKNQTNNVFPKFQWQRSFHDHIIRDTKDFQQHWHYATYNYLKHGLPSNWPYTSHNFPELIN